AIAHLAARTCDVLVLRVALQCARERADDQHQAGGAQGARFIDRAMVIVERPRAVLGGHAGEHPAAAVATEFDAGVLQECGNTWKSDRCDLLAPRRERADSAACAFLDDAIELPLHAHGGSVDRKPAVISAEIAHHASTPCNASRWRMRRAAS